MNSRFARTCFAGFLGTIVVACLVAFASPQLVGGPADIASVFARILGGSWLAGMAMYFLIGTLALPAVYYVLLHRRLFAGPAVRGAAFGMALWLFAQAIVIPLTGGGLFSSRLGGLPAVADSLMGHLAYGLVLGLFAGGTHERIFSVRPRRIGKPHLRRAA